MKRRSDVTVLAVGLIALVIVLAVAAVIAPPPPAPALSARSSDRDGAMALELWLKQSGYRVREVLSYGHLADLDVLLVLQPLAFQFADSDAATIQRWVERGHTLIAVGTPLALNPVIQPYRLSLHYLPTSDQSLAQAAPLLLSPPVNPFQGEAVAVVFPDDQTVQLVPRVFSNDQPVLASLTVGQGQVWVSGALRPFTNQGLHDPESAKLIANLLTSVPRGSTIGFDEAAHGFGDTSQATITGWLFGTAPGWGIILALVITMSYLALRGRRFGRAVPLPEERLRRESVEYIVAMGTLFRRSGQRQAVLEHYDEQVRRRMAERYAVDPKLDAVEFVNAVAYRDPTLDDAALRDLMLLLKQTSVSERELVETVYAVDNFLRSLN